MSASKGRSRIKKNEQDYFKFSQKKTKKEVLTSLIKTQNQMVMMRMKLTVMDSGLMKSSMQQETPKCKTEMKVKIQMTQMILRMINKESIDYKPLVTLTFQKQLMTSPLLSLIHI